MSHLSEILGFNGKSTALAQRGVFKLQERELCSLSRVNLTSSAQEWISPTPAGISRSGRNPEKSSSLTCTQVGRGGSLIQAQSRNLN